MAKDNLSDQTLGKGALTGRSDELWFGHPRGLSTLFFTEMWERFSYYGMRGLLVLFMIAPAVGSNGGLGLGIKDATAVYGLYTALVYLVALPGGWVADKIWGLRKSVFVGGSIIAAGHFSMAAPILGFPQFASFVLGLFLIIIGTGLLKPSISAIVGDLYEGNDARRDAGFSIYYMGINIGALLGPLFCGYFGEGVNWHLGFSLAGFGMVLGLIQYKYGEGSLGQAGLYKHDGDDGALERRKRRAVYGFGAAILATGLFALGLALGWFEADLQLVATGIGLSIILMSLIFFGYVIFFGGHSKEERNRVWVIFCLFILSAIFWSGFEQAGSSMNIFAQKLTDLKFGNFEAPASWLQAVNPLFIIILAPLFAGLWTWLDRRHANPSLPLKFGLGFLALAIGFFVLAWGAANASPKNLVSPAWLVVTYFLHTCGELFVSPLGLSAITKLAPRTRLGQMMGVWFIGAALGNLIGGLMAGYFGQVEPGRLFANVAIMAAAAGFVAVLISPFLTRMMGGVR